MVEPGPRLLLLLDQSQERVADPFGSFDLAHESRDTRIGLGPAIEHDRFAGLFDGSTTVLQSLKGGEARVISVHEKVDHPQFISTNRHMMQGYVDMPGKPEWNSREMQLTGTSAVIAGEPYSIIIALNGYTPESVLANDAESVLELLDASESLARLTIHSDKTGEIVWAMKFVK